MLLLTNFDIYLKFKCYLNYFVEEIVFNLNV